MGEDAQWLGPGETARRLGVTLKALRVYEREGLVVPHRAQSRWRLYGPAEIARLHQIIVLRDLGLPLKAIKALVGRRSRLGDVLRLQHDALMAQQERIGRAIALIEAARRRLDEGGDLCLDDLAVLTRETVVQPSAASRAFKARFEALVAEKDPTGQASRALDQVSKDVLADGEDALKARVKAMLAEAARLKEAGDVNSEAAKAFVRRMRARMAAIRRPPEAEQALMRDAFARAMAEAQARNEPLPFDPAVFEFIGQVAQGMKDRGELE